MALHFTLVGVTGVTINVWGDFSRTNDARVNSDPTFPELYGVLEDEAGVVVQAKCALGQGPTDAELDADGDWSGLRFRWYWASQPPPYGPVALTTTAGQSSEVTFSLPVGALFVSGEWRLRCDLVVDSSGKLVRSIVLPLSVEYRP